MLPDAVPKVTPCPVPPVVPSWILPERVLRFKFELGLPKMVTTPVLPDCTTMLRAIEVPPVRALCRVTLALPMVSPSSTGLVALPSDPGDPFAAGATRLTVPARIEVTPE